MAGFPGINVMSNGLRNFEDRHSDSRQTLPLWTLRRNRIRARRYRCHTWRLQVCHLYLGRYAFKLHRREQQCSGADAEREKIQQFTPSIP